MPTTATATLEFAGVRISSPERQVLDDPPLRKADLARYYAAMAERILPHIAARPLSIVRCPERLGESCFFQRHPAPGMGKSIRPIKPEDGAPYLSVDAAEGLLTLVQFGAIELHPGGARRDRLDRPDRLVFDLDPGPGVDRADLVAAAREVRDRLQALKLDSFCRTTGGKGLHVVVPIDRRHDWPSAKAFAAGIARAMEADSPDRHTATLAKHAREGRVFIDYLRNDPSSSAIATWSLRGRQGALIATPLSWEEVTPGLDPAAFTIATIQDRLRRHPEPWPDLARIRQRLPEGARQADGASTAMPIPVGSSSS